MAEKFTKAMSVGLGEAIQRLIAVEIQRSRGLAKIPAESLAERNMIVDALNTQQLDLGFDCDSDGIPDTVAIFSKSAQTSCCRLVRPDSDKRTYESSRRR